MHSLPQHIGSISALGTLLLMTNRVAEAQVTFSIEGHGPLIAVPDAFTGTAITEGDLLTPATQPPFGPNYPALLAPIPPGIWTSAGLGPPAGLGIPTWANCVGHPPAIPCPIEVDALSYGVDFPLIPAPQPPGTFRFSVDEYATGFATPFPPNVFSEGSIGPEFEAAADVFVDIGTPVPPPIPPFAIPPGNVAVIDGNGLPGALGWTYPGFGVFEPNFPGVPPDMGDNVDAFDELDGGFVVPFPVYYSLDAPWPDPINGFPHWGTAAVLGFSGADVLVTRVAGGPPMIFAPAPLLGLDLMGFNSDDLDALALLENGTGAFEPSRAPYDWLGGMTDMLLFSVRRGSAVIGRVDSILGLPIEPGDILTTPLLGGGSPFPGIFIAAENLGLVTGRSMGVAFGDDLDALDVTALPLFDCNGNGVEDAIDIALGSSTDLNGNGIPDDCEILVSPYCYCTTGICGNADALAGCRNSTGSGALLTYAGSTSVVTDNLMLTMAPLPANKFGIFYMGTTTPMLPFGDGYRCVGGSIFRYPPINSGAGSITFGPIVGWANAHFVPAGHILPGASWNIQGWYRDPMGPCGTGWNLTNAGSFTFTP